MENWKLYLLVALSLAAGIVKITGGLLYNSKSLLVDALTCIANVIALIAVLKFHLVSISPPDEDHPYGHERLAFGGVISTLLIYSFVAGVIIMELLDVAPYRVDINAAIYAGVGFAIYFVVVILSRGVGKAFKTYSVMTVSELIESGVVVFAALGGALIIYYIDYIGAIALSAYLFVEIYAETRKLIRLISDIAPSREVREGIMKEFLSAGLEVKSLKLRVVGYNRIQGDAVISMREDEDLHKILEKVRSVKDRVAQLYRADMSIEIEEIN